MTTQRQKNGYTRRALGVLCGLGALVIAGCHQDMWNQPRYAALQENDFFANRMASRPLVEGTVPYLEPKTDEHYYTGKIDGDYAATFPAQILENWDTKALLLRGRERYEIYCSPCHSYTGDGNGMIVQRGMKQAASYHNEKYKDPAQVTSRPGYFFDVITNGFGVMFSYANRVSVEDRWAIAAYIQALQLSQDATQADVPEAEWQKLLHPEAAADAHAGDSHGHDHGEH